MELHLTELHKKIEEEVSFRMDIDHKIQDFEKRILERKEHNEDWEKRYITIWDERYRKEKELTLLQDYLDHLELQIKKEREE